MIHSYQAYKESTQKFLDWIRNISNKYDPKCKQLPTTLVALRKRVNAILHISPSILIADRAIYKDIPHILKDGEKAIQVRGLINAIYFKKLEKTISKQEQEFDETHKQEFSSYITILKECHSKLQFWYEHNFPRFADRRRESSSRSRTAEVPNSPLASVSEDEDPTIASPLSGEEQQQEENCNLNVDYEQIEKRFTEMRIRMLCFFLDLINAVEILCDSWKKVKNEEINIITAGLVTFTVMKQISSLINTLIALFPILKDSSYFFYSMQKELSPIEFEWICNQPFFQLFYGIFSYYYTFSKTIFKKSELNYCRPLIPIRELYGKLYQEFYSEASLSSTEEDIYRFLSNEIPIIYNSIVDWIRDRDYESYLKQIIKEHYMLPYYLKEFSNFFNHKTTTIHLVFITYCWMQIIQLLQDASSHILSKTIYISREYVRRRRKNLYMNTTLVTILQQLEDHDNNKTMNYIKWLRKPEKDEKALRLYWRYSLHQNNPFFSIAFMVDFTLFDLQHTTEFYDISSCYHRIILHIYHALMKENYLKGEKLPILDDFQKMFDKKIFYPNGVKPMRSGDYVTSYYLSRGNSVGNILDTQIPETFDEIVAWKEQQLYNQQLFQEVPSSSGAISVTSSGNNNLSTGVGNDETDGNNNKSTNSNVHQENSSSSTHNQSSSSSVPIKKFIKPTKDHAEKVSLNVKFTSNIYRFIALGDDSFLYSKYFNNAQEYSLHELTSAILKESEYEIKENKILSVDLLIYLQAFHEFFDFMKKEIPVLQEGFTEDMKGIIAVNDPSKTNFFKNAALSSAASSSSSSSSTNQLVKSSSSSSQPLSASAEYRNSLLANEQSCGLKILKILDKSKDDRTENESKLLLLYTEKFVSYWSKFSANLNENGSFFYIIPNNSMIPESENYYHHEFHENSFNLSYLSKIIHFTGNKKDDKKDDKKDEAKEKASGKEEEKKETVTNSEEELSLVKADNNTKEVTGQEEHEKFITQYHHLFEIAYRISQKKDLKQREWIHDQIKKLVKENITSLLIYECFLIDQIVKKFPPPPRRSVYSEKKGTTPSPVDDEASLVGNSLVITKVFANPFIANSTALTTSSSSSASTALTDNTTILDLYTILDLIFTDYFLQDPDLGEWLFASGYGIRLYAYMVEKKVPFLFARVIQKGLFWATDLLSGVTSKNGFLIPHPLTGDSRFHDIAKFNQEILGRFLVNLGIPLHIKNYENKTLIPYFKNRDYANHMNIIMNDYEKLATKLLSTYAQAPNLLDISLEIKLKIQEEEDEARLQQQYQQLKLSGGAIATDPAKGEIHWVMKGDAQKGGTKVVKKGGNKKETEKKQITEEDEAKAKKAEKELLEMLEKEETKKPNQPKKKK
jgi:hypothetical protein